MKNLYLILLVLGVSNLIAQPILPTMTEMLNMRDGNKIAADVYLPGNGSYPVILIQTPYNKNLYRLGGLPLGIKSQIGSSAYAIVIADWRCFYGSTAACVPQYDRGKDGYDLIEWISQQTWSNGKVGTWGPSALGKIQYQTAKEQHPAHICAVPVVAGPQFQYEEYFPGGCLRAEYVDQLDALGYGLAPTLLANPQYNLTWQIVENTNTYYDKIKIPMLLIGGWYDHNADIQVEAFNALKNSSDIAVRNQHRLLMGPWVHGGFRGSGPGSTGAGALSFPLAQGWSDSLALLFLNYHLRGITNGWESTPTVQYYRMGLEKWESSASYPTGNTQDRTYYLSGSKQLLLQQDPGSELSFPYDPANPSPTIGGTTLRNDLLQGPYDQGPLVESREDIISFTSEVLQEAVNLNGKSKAIIWFASDKTDTDICLRLTDVYPDERSMLLGDGVHRLRFRDSFSSPQNMVPGQAYEVEINLPVLCHTFMPGHQIRLDVSSSNYPRFDSNLNNGGAMYTAGDTLEAQQTVFFSGEKPSRLILPVDAGSSVGIEKFSGPKIQVFPNPFQESIQVLLGETLCLKLYSSDGKLLFETIFSKGSHLLEFPNLKPGIYFLNASKSSGEFSVQKLIRIN